MRKLKVIFSCFVVVALLLSAFPTSSLATETTVKTSDQNNEVKGIVVAETAEDTVKLFKEDSMDSDVLTLIPDNTEVTVLKKGKNNTYVGYIDQKTKEPLSGYIENSSLVEPSQIKEALEQRATQQPSDKAVDAAKQDKAKERSPLNKKSPQGDKVVSKTDSDKAAEKGESTIPDEPTSEKKEKFESDQAKDTPKSSTKETEKRPSDELVNKGDEAPKAEPDNTEKKTAQIRTIMSLKKVSAPSVQPEFRPFLTLLGQKRSKLGVGSK